MLKPADNFYSKREQRALENALMLVVWSKQLVLESFLVPFQNLRNSQFSGKDKGLTLRRKRLKEQNSPLGSSAASSWMNISPGCF